MYTSRELYHHGILGQKWGKRNGPPYPLPGGAYTKAEKEAIYEERKKKHSIYNKKHFDEVLTKENTHLTTLSYNPNRTRNTDMFYAIHTPTDVHQYNAMFNKAVPQDVYDSDGRKVGTGTYLKWRIDNGLKKDYKVASEDSASKAFVKLYSKDRDFYNFVTDEKRMQSHFVKEKYRFRGYREARHVLKKMRADPTYIPNEEELKIVYRMFNYVIPSDGNGDVKRAKDVYTQRAKFFRELKNAGYGAVLDTNDGIYGGFKAQSPIIVFDIENVIQNDAYRTTLNSKRFSEVAYTGRKMLGI